MVCAPIVQKLSVHGQPLRRWMGRNWRPVPPLNHSQVRRSTGNWAPLIAEAFGIPLIKSTSAKAIGDYCSTTADHIDQYYGLAGHVVEAELGKVHEARLITVGLIDLANNRWGRASTKYNKSSFDVPIVDLHSLGADDPALAQWAERRLIPKVLVATQTRVIEAIVDERRNSLAVSAGSHGCTTGCSARSRGRSSGKSDFSGSCGTGVTWIGTLERCDQDLSEAACCPTRTR